MHSTPWQQSHTTKHVQYFMHFKRGRDIPVSSYQQHDKIRQLPSDSGMAVGYYKRLTCPYEEQRDFLEHLITRAEMGDQAMKPC